MISRRRAIKTTAITAAAVATGAFAGPVSRLLAGPPEKKNNAPAGPFQVPPLAYPFDALEPHVDARTMEIHHCWGWTCGSTPTI